MIFSETIINTQTTPLPPESPIIPTPRLRIYFEDDSDDNTQKTWNNTIKAITQNTTTVLLEAILQENINKSLLAQLTAALQKNTTLTALKFEGHRLSLHDTAVIVQALSHQTLQLLSLKCMNDDDNDDENIKTIADALKGNCTLKSLSLDYPPGSNAKKPFALLLEEGVSLTALSLMNKKMTAQEVSSLAKALEKNSLLTSLCLPGCHIGPDEAQELGQSLQRNFSLTNLDLTVNDIGTGMPAFIQALTKNSSLLQLKLVANKIFAAEVTELALHLPDCSFTSLDLSRNQGLGLGVQALAAALRASRITSLNLKRVDLTAAALSALAEVLPHSSIRSLDFSWNQALIPQGVCRFITALPNSSITSINFGPIRGSVTTTLASVLPHCKITSLAFDTSFNREDREMIQLAEALPQSSITSLTLGHSSGTWSPAIQSAITQALPQSRITSLCIMDPVGIDQVQIGRLVQQNAVKYGTLTQLAVNAVRACCAIYSEVTPKIGF